jgi:hypothetical protein
MAAVMQEYEEKINEYKTIVDEKDEIIKILYQEIKNIKKSSQSKTTNEQEESLNNDNENSNNNTPTVLKIKNFRDSEHFTFNNNLNKNEFSENNENIKKNYLDNINFIKEALINFLRMYNIKEELSKTDPNEKNIDNIIDIAFKDIKYIVVNLKKINIIYKSLMIEFSKNIMATVEIYLKENINNKLKEMNKRIENLFLSVNK